MARKMKVSKTRQEWTFLPITGILLSVVLYVIAAQYYPGGSNVDQAYEGFDWINNYWCDLIATRAKNGEFNMARMIALLAMIFLFVSLAVFWFFLPRFFHEGKLNTLIISYTGSISMLVLMFISTRFHDSIIGIGISLLAIPIAATLKELYWNKLTGLYVLGLACVMLILLNIFIYWTNWWIIALPLIQKITLLLFLIWIVLIGIVCWRIHKVKSPVG